MTNEEIEKMAAQGSGTALKAAATGVEAAKPKSFPDMLEAWKPEIARALPRHMSVDRITRIALTAFRRNPKLGECDPRSVFAAVIQSSQLGLEIDTLGRGYLVPYDKRKKAGNQWRTVSVECQFIPGWKGLVDLMNRSKHGTVWTGADFEGDEFDYQLGDSPRVFHKPGGEDAPEKLRHVYAVGRIAGSDWPIVEVWPISKVRRHRDRYNKVGDSHYSYSNWEMYARKIPLLQVLKYMPCSVELAQAITLNDAGEMGDQNLTIKDALDGSWTYAGEVAGAADDPADNPPIEDPKPDAKAEVKSAGPEDKYNALLARLQNAVSKDVLDVDADLMALVAGERQDWLQTLTAAYHKRKSELDR